MFKGITKGGGHWGWFVVIAAGVFTGMTLIPKLWNFVASKIGTKA